VTIIENFLSGFSKPPQSSQNCKSCGNIRSRVYIVSISKSCSGWCDILPFRYGREAKETAEERRMHEPEWLFWHVEVTIQLDHSEEKKRGKRKEFEN
jgi:hypothetical protein